MEDHPGDLAARRKRRRRSTTRPGRGRWRAPDLVRRDFPAAAINVKWYGDGTDIDTDEGKLYLDSVLDVGSRRVLGFALGEHHDADLPAAHRHRHHQRAVGQLRVVVLAEREPQHPP